MKTEALSIFSGHDASLCIAYDHRGSRAFAVLELERLTRKRYFSLSASDAKQTVLADVRDYLSALGLPTQFTHAFGQCDSSTLNALKEVFGISRFDREGHHEGHAAVGLYLSAFRQAWIVSYDGGGKTRDGKMVCFRIFYGDKEDKQIPIRHIGDVEINLGTAYLVLASLVGEIRRPDPWDWIAANGLAGKLMGLAGYGEIRADWLAPLQAFFRDYNGYSLSSPALDALSSQLRLTLAPGVLSFQFGRDLAATAQRALEMLVIEIVDELLGRRHLPVIMTGGCALNVQINQRLRDKGLQVFVPPCPNDCGLSLGFSLSAERPSDPPDITYSGFRLIDFPEWVPGPQFRHLPEPSELEHLIAGALISGKIIAVARAGSEVGPRALGNRSILAHVGRRGLKEMINARIKFREPFRPVAAVVRFEDSSEFFETFPDQESPSMSFAPGVRPQWRDRLAEITHVDGTCRIQTVTAEQNSFLDRILRELTRKGEIPILLNTSFNSKARPLITTIREACEVFENTPLDGLVIEDWVRFKL